MITDNAIGANTNNGMLLSLCLFLFLLSSNSRWNTFVLKPHEFKIITITVIINEPGFYLFFTNNLDATFLNVLDVCFDGV